ncbi:MAG: EAL domain-containing protein [Lachnospiraceae bacterium]|nr:EAL domain-containing protein [Lachnospiraceae bacterium]
MIYFEDLPLDKEIVEALSELSINYVFQSIFYPDGKTIFAREALMRPTDMTVTELIEKYTKMEKLHILEVATCFGAMQEYILRGYTENLCINSFPTEYFSKEETRVLFDYYGKQPFKVFLEILEYPYYSESIARLKKYYCEQAKSPISIDDFGSGINDMKIVDTYSPALVKIDRSLITDIDTDPLKQEKVADLIKDFHEREISVVAEGVETKGEFEFMRDAGADFFQGFYLHRPA